MKRLFTLLAGLCACATTAAAQDVQVRVGMDELNAIAAAVDVPSITFSRVIDFYAGTCTIRGTATIDSVTFYESNGALRYRAAGEVPLSGWCIDDSTRGFTATGTVTVRNRDDGVELDFGSARASLRYWGFTFSSYVRVPDIELPLRPLTLDTADGQQAFIGLIGQQTTTTSTTVTARGNVWVR